MIHLISSDGQLTAPCIIQHNSPTQAISNCLQFIKNALQLNIKMGIFDSSSASYQLLTQALETKSFIEFKGKIFIPILKPDRKIWGFIEITCFPTKPTPAKIRKALQTVKDMIEPTFFNTSENTFNKDEHSSILILESDAELGHKISLNIFYQEKLTSFINLTEWIQQDNYFSLKSLRGFSDSLLFVPEILKLTPNQRSILALYSMLPHQLKNSSLIICTKESNASINAKLKDEQHFLKSFIIKKALQ